tara:strand:- start:8484 stop:10946 length:2463 start_codon:yes stop_codon:yes gene_type:complete
MALDEHYIVEISNSASGYIRLSTKEFGNTDSSGYHGYIINKPTIRESIDLEESTSRTSNVTLTCLNGTINNITNDPKLSAEIFGGSAHYINRDVTIKSRINSVSDTLIYTGRLKSASINNDETVTLTITAKTPIDFVKIPKFTSKSGKFFPIAYGSGTSEVSTISIPGFIDSARCFPLEVDSLNNEQFNCLAFQEISAGSSTDTGFDTDGIGDQSLLADVTDNTFQIINGTIPTAFEVGKVIQIDSEKMLITASAFVPSTFVSITVIRAYAGTTLAAHADGADIYSVAMATGIDDGKLHYPIKDMYDSNGFPLFCPLLLDNNVYSTENSINLYEGEENNNKPILTAPLNLKRGYFIRPQTVETSSTFSTTSNIANAYDTSDSTFATLTHSASDDFAVGASFVLQDLPREEHSIKKCNLKFKYQITAFDEPTGGNENLIFKYKAYINGVVGEAVNGADQAAVMGSAGNITIDLLSTSNFSSTTSRVPENITLSFSAISSGNIGQGSGDTHGLTVKVFDMYLEINTEIDATDSDKDIQNLIDSNAVKSVDRLYTPADGLDQAYSAGTSVTNIVQMHRDLIHRFAGITSTPQNYSALNTARSGWNIFYYLNEETDLLEILDQCQKEGGFIFRFRASDNEPQYLYITNSVSASKTLTKDDLKNTKISLTDFDSLKTKRIIKHQRNPINDELLFEVECVDTTNDPRTAYNVQSDENVITEDLEILTGNIVNGQEGKTITSTNMGAGNKNDGYANYYNAIQGVPKLIIETEIVNPSHFDIDVGDVIAMSHTNQIAAPFGQSFDGKKFFTTSVSRSIGHTKIQMREI